MQWTIFPYGAALAAAALAAMALLAFGTGRSLKPGSASWAALLGVPLAFLGARLGYCLFRLPWFMSKGVGWFFAFTEGGYVLFGALGGLALAGWLTAKITRQSAARVLDAMAAPGVLATLIAKIGDGLAGQGYGWPIAEWFSVDAFDPEEYTGMSLFHLEDAGFFERLPFSVQDSFYGEWHWAVFVLEALVALVILTLVLRARVSRPGSRAIKAFALLCALAVLSDSMRQDEVLRWGVIRISQVLGAVCLAGMMLVCCLRLPSPRPRKRMVLGWISLFAAAGLVMAMEFALEKKIVFLEFLPMDVCYVLICLGCVWLWLSIRPLWKAQDGAQGRLA